MSSSIIFAPGINATDAMTYSFPSDFNGVWSGLGTNFNCSTPYEVRLSIDGCNAYGEECGEAAYPPLVGGLTYVAPIDCVDHLNGAAPTGRCYEFAEDFVGASELEPPFWYSFVVLAEQEDGTFFWTFQQGGMGVATAYLSLNAGVQQGASSFAAEQDTLLKYVGYSATDPVVPLPLGSGVVQPIFSELNNLPASFGGMWRSDKIENFLGNLGNDIELDVAEGGCPMIPLPGNIQCGADMELPAINSKRSLLFQLRPQCIASQQGPNPVGKCYMLLSFDLQLPLANNWDADSLGFYTVSEQEDGNLWWSWNYGPVSRAAGLLTRD